MALIDTVEIQNSSEKSNDKHRSKVIEKYSCESFKFLIGLICATSSLIGLCIGYIIVMLLSPVPSFIIVTGTKLAATLPLLFALAFSSLVLFVGVASIRHKIKKTYYKAVVIGFLANELS